MPGELDDLFEIPPSPKELKTEEQKPEEQAIETASAEPIAEPVAVQPEPVLAEEVPSPELQPESELRDPFEARQVDPEPVSPQGDIEITYSPSRVSNYSALKNLAKFFKFLAWVLGLGGIASLLYSIQFYDGAWGRPEPEFSVFLSVGLGALFLVIPTMLKAENINLMLDIEANSRQAAKTLERILRSR